VMECIIETKAATILQFVAGLRGDLHITFEEGTWAAWLFDLLKPHVTQVVVCNPRRNALLKEGNKSDRIDARKLAELLRGGLLRPVYHGENGIRTLKELARSYLTINKDLTRVMNRVNIIATSIARDRGTLSTLRNMTSTPFLSYSFRSRKTVYDSERLAGLRPSSLGSAHEPAAYPICQTFAASSKLAANCANFGARSGSIGYFSTG